MIIEICCTSKTSLYNAINGGASRLELCKNLLEDGLTPSPKFLEYVLNHSPIHVHVLIRPRRGNFVYTPEEVKTTVAQIEMAKSLGANGIVMGALNED
ncbi:MAG: copper homeostasis protein CutC, partial [Flavobacteriaceae bacterium]